MILHNKNNRSLHLTPPLIISSNSNLSVIKKKILTKRFRHTGNGSGAKSLAVPFSIGGESSGAVTVTFIGNGGILISMWSFSSMDKESMLHRVSLDGERTDGNRPAVKRSGKMT